jgi:Flp pilus assembly protein TadG
MELNMESCKKRYEKGQSLTEFAISFTFIILLLVGVVDFGRAFFTFMALRDAVQEGALYGSLHPTNSAGIASRVKGVSNGPIDMSQVTVTSGVLGGATPCAGQKIEVTATYQFHITMPFLGTILGTQSFPLTASVIDNILLPPCEP